MSNTGLKHIYKVRGKYRIMVTRNKKTRSYGTYATLNDARLMRDRLIREGKITKYNGAGQIRNYPDRYIHKQTINGKTSYKVRKYIDGELCHFGTFKSLEVAREERDYMESIDWDYSNM